jgi:type VI secretion system protein ImpH
VAAAVRMESAHLRLAAIERALEEDPNTFEFFQAVRLLELLRPERLPPGAHGDPEKEAVHFGVTPALGYPASEIQTLDTEDVDSPARMTVNFMGLTGPSGVLPYVYSQLVTERLQSRDTAMQSFFDLFHHRMISLFYAAWEKNRYEVHFERTGEDALSRHLRDLVGLGLESESKVGEIATESLAGYAGLLGPEPRGAVGLEQLLSDQFDVPVAVEQFLGAWYPVVEADQCALDDAGNRGRLGYGSLVGDEVWDTQGRVRLRIGPLDRAHFESFLPTGEAHERLRTLTRLWCHDQFEFEVQLVLERNDVPGLVLAGHEPDGERLGWSTWIRTRPLDDAADQTVLRL